MAKKLDFLGSQRLKMAQKDRNNYSQISDIQFDELQTIEHTKLKKSVAVAVIKERGKYWG